MDEPLWGQVAFPVAVYSVARYGSTAASLAAVAVGLVGAGVASYDWLRPFPDSSDTAYLAYALSIGAIVVSAWAVGAQRRTRQAYVDALVERGERLEREAAQQAALAAIDERHRIAREMHDVVAHGLTTIVVQADGARAAVAQDPRVAAPALATIAEAGREAIAEMRRMLGLLRSEVGETAPQPRLADLAGPDRGDHGRRYPGRRRAPRARSRWSPTASPSRRTASSRRRSPTSASTPAPDADGDGAAARGRRAAWSRWSDDGRGAAAPYDGRGLGLTGMRERVTAHGGHLDAGPRPGGGFAVHARIPL